MSEKRDSVWVLKTFLGIALGGTALAGIVGGAILWHFSRDLPAIITVADYRPLTVTRIYGAPDPLDPKADLLMGEFYKERRYVVAYEQIPDVVIKAFISAEDDKFFEHMGVNVSSMIRAGIANFRAGRVVQGGSTITQQVAKSLLLTPERSFGRKMKEVILANRIERNLTKQQILFLYLNQIYLGHGAYGVQAAARTYYRKDVAELTIAESAVLAGLPQAPHNYSPLVSPRKAKERQLYVLRRMLENKFINQKQMQEAAAAPLKIFHDEDLSMKYAPYLVEHARRGLLDKYGEKAVYEDGLTVQLASNPRLAKIAGKSLRNGLLQVDKRIGYRGPLQHFDSVADIETFLKEQRSKLIQRRVHHQLLMPDGHLDAMEAMKAAGLVEDFELLEPGEFYQAVVTSFDEKKKSAGVMIGGVHAELPLERMSWARAPRDEHNPNAPRPAPTSPSRILRKGDVILTRLADDMKGYDRSHPFVALEQDPALQGALLSIEAQTGFVLAMEGGYDFEASEFNRAVQAQRQPGSAFKPIVYACALEKGYSPATIIVDSPIVYDDAETGKWKPSNFEEKFYGDTTFRQALIHSRNVPTIKIIQSLQVSPVIAYSKRLGMNGTLNNDLSIALGSGGFSLMEMTKAYALFPRLGRKVAPIFVTKVTDREGKVLDEQKAQSLPASVTLPPVRSPDPSPVAVAGSSPAPSAAPGVLGRTGILTAEYPLANDPVQVLDPRVAYVMTHLMKEVVSYGTGQQAKALQRAAAGKTGTTTDYIDAWFMGFTPYIVTGVWVGFDGQKSIGPAETGAKAALPIWLSFMKEAVKPYPDTDFTIPPGVVFATINPTTGRLASPNSSDAIQEAFVEGTQPTEMGPQSGGAHESDSEFFKEDVE